MGIANAPQMGIARGGALILTIMTAEKWVVGEGGEEGFVDFANLPYPHVTASANQPT